MKAVPYANFLLFVFGVFNQTRIFLYGALGISEMVMFVLGPIILLREFKQLRREGFMTLIVMLFALIVSMLISSCYNHTAFPFVFKSFASLYSVFCYVMTFYWLLRNNYNGIGWFFLGNAISGIITIFVLNPSAMVDASGGAFIGQQEAEDVDFLIKSVIESLAWRFAVIINARKEGTIESIFSNICNVVRDGNRR